MIDLSTFIQICHTYKKNNLKTKNKNIQTDKLKQNNLKYLLILYKDLVILLLVIFIICLILNELVHSFINKNNEIIFNSFNCAYKYKINKCYWLYHHKKLKEFCVDLYNCKEKIVVFKTNILIDILCDYINILVNKLF